MRWAPSIVPDPAGRTFYLVIERSGASGLFRETTIERTELEEVLDDLQHGQYSEPLEVMAFNPTEGWSKNVTEDVAAELQRRADLAGDEPLPDIASFIERSIKRERQLALRLV